MKHNQKLSNEQIHSNKLRVRLLFLLIAIAIITGISFWLFSIFAPRTLYINSDTFDVASSMRSEQNFFSKKISGEEFEIYRAAISNFDDYLFKLDKQNRNNSDDALAGSIQNINCLNGIKQIKIGSKSKSSYKISAGDYPLSYKYNIEIDASDNVQEHILNIPDNPSYFSIETIDSDVCIAYIEITYGGSSIQELMKVPVYHNTSNNYPTNHNPSEGDTITIQEYTKNTNGEEVPSATKTYTYHSLAFVKERARAGESVDSYALTNQIDVANYYLVFNRIPPNFGGIKGPFKTSQQGVIEYYDDVCKYFGDKTRGVQVSHKWYLGSNNYSEKLLYNKETEPEYYEFDIGQDDNYSDSNRGNNRLVIFVSGLTIQAEGEICIYCTDDHYYTFSEYSNKGYWNERFDALSKIKTLKQYQN